MQRSTIRKNKPEWAFLGECRLVLFLSFSLLFASFWVFFALGKKEERRQPNQVFFFFLTRGYGLKNGDRADDKLRISMGFFTFLSSACFAYFAFQFHP